MSLPFSIKQLGEKIRVAGGTAYLVGGAVRDRLMGVADKRIKDWDVEVFGLDSREIQEVLEEIGKVSLVGKSFGVFKVTTREELDLDVSLPRRETKIAEGHRGFEVEFCPDITTKEAAARRDFTINSIMMDMVTEEVIDHFDGQKDIERRILRHTSPAFAEDPLRVLRGMQFATRFGMRVDPDTAKLCQSLRSEFHTLPKERIWGECEKMFTKSKVDYLDLAWAFLFATGWLHLFPPFAWVSSSYFIKVRDQQDLQGEQLVVASLAAGEASEEFMECIGVPKKLKERVTKLVNAVQYWVHQAEWTVENARRLAVVVSPETDIQEVSLVMSVFMPEQAEALLETAKQAGVLYEPPSPLVMGRHLIDRGNEPGPWMGEMLRKAYEGQLGDHFKTAEEGIAWLFGKS